MTDDEIKDNPFLEKVSVIVFTTIKGTGIASATVKLSQINYDIVPVKIPKCVLGGATYSFGIRSNTKWRITKIEEFVRNNQGVLERNSADKTFLNLKGTDNLRENHVGGRKVDSYGDKISFTVTTKDIQREGEIRVTFKCEQSNCSAKVIKIPIVISKWARSNIVLHNGKPTFAVTHADNEKIPADVQGVYFQWGSLVAISPIGTKYNKDQILWPSSAPKPDVWREIKWFTESNYLHTNTEYDQQDKELYSFSFWKGNNDKGYDVSTFKGDICRYISAQPDWIYGTWRIPTRKELEDLIKEGSVQWESQTNVWDSKPTSPVAPNAGSSSYGDYKYGFWQPAAGHFIGEDVDKNDLKSNPVRGITFVAAGQRAATESNSPLFVDGDARNRNYAGHVWSSTQSNHHGAYYFSLTEPGMNVPTQGAQRCYAFPIRCIRVK